MAILLRQSNKTSLSDIDEDIYPIGLWSGDRIAIVGQLDCTKMFRIAENEFGDISAHLFSVLEDLMEKSIFSKKVKGRNNNCSNLVDDHFLT
ncbi:MAG: hypothetical protein ACFFD4_27405 [Candidatus Odinarchaeota archaeon]